MASSFLAVVLVGLVVVMVPRLVGSMRARRSAASSSTWVLTPTGQRPDDLDQTTGAMNALVNDLSSAGRDVGIAVHRWRDAHEVVTAVTVWGHPDPQRVADQFARNVGASAEEYHEDVPTPGYAYYSRRYDHIGRDPHATDQREALDDVTGWLAEVLSQAPPHGMCVSVGLEPARRWEARELRRWHNVREESIRNAGEGTGRGHAARSKVLVFSDDATAAQQVASGLPAQLLRFPFTTKGRLVNSMRTWGALAGWFAAATIVPAVTAAVQSAFDPGSAGPGQVMFGDPAGWVLVGGTVVCTVLALVAWRLPVPVVNRAQATHADLHLDGFVPIERPWYFSAARIIRNVLTRLNPLDQNLAREDFQRSIAYPFRVVTLTLNPIHLAQVGVFPDTAQTATARTDATRIAAPGAVARLGAQAPITVASPLGRDHRGNAVAVPDSDRKSGIFITGDPGTGKTGALMSLLRSDLAARRDGRRDGRMAMLWLETKGVGAREVERVLELEGYRQGRHPHGWVTLHANAERGPRLEVIDRSDPAGSAQRLVGALTYAFEQGAIGARAAEALRAAFRLVLAIPPDVAAAAMPASAGQLNVLHAAELLMMASGTQGSKVKADFLHAVTIGARKQVLEQFGEEPVVGGVDMSRLVDSAQAEAANAEDGATVADTAAGLFDRLGSMPKTGVELFDALNGWMVYEITVSRRMWSEMFESPRNKVSRLKVVDPLWTPAPGRPSVPLRELLDHFAVGLLNFGDSPYGAIESDTSEKLVAMTTYLLWEDIKRVCPGWLDQGKSVGLYADELSHVSGAGSGDDVIGAMFDQGRSYGVQLALATQRYGQIPERTKEAALSFGTRMYLRLENVNVASEAALDLNRGDENGPFSVRDISEMPNYTGAMRMIVEGAPQPVFTLRVDDPRPEDRTDAVAETPALPGASASVAGLPGRSPSPVDVEWRDDGTGTGSRPPAPEPLPDRVPAEGEWV